MEPRPCSFPILYLPIIAARHYSKRHILSDLVWQIFRINPVRRIIRVVIVTIHDLHIATVMGLWIIIMDTGDTSTRVPAIAITLAADAAMPSILTVTLRG